VESDNKEVVTALREIAAGKVTIEEPKRLQSSGKRVTADSQGIGTLESVVVRELE